MAEKKFKVGDRVKVEFEGVYDGEGGVAGAYLKVGDRGAYVPELSALTLIERPVEPLAPGSVVLLRGRSATFVFVVGYDRVHRVGPGRDYPETTYTATDLARRAARPDSGFTLIYDGSNKA